MAEDGAEIDLPAHARTYGRFLGLFKWSAIVVFILAAIIVLVISR
ncbi:aa3-type cytochrome c oxidase subunit IV [uncultured Sphingomonas sp.]|nr:aa3-type cytochrome c oxidase subunit IV [uncultured Sphingomonas sp.]